ncbi:MAG: hypothetical protein EHM64_07720 [Ignavibacteriae bacterium]|nr:MAG: hypothetical protein EHM64_07720 [Ignavibacteriota bacterium]
MKAQNILLQILLVSLFLGVVGCKKSDNPTGSVSSNPSVSLSVAFTKAGSLNGLMKVSRGLSADSLRIDSAIVVFDRIKFESHVDTVEIDTMGGMSMDDTQDMNVVFVGPFVVHIRDTMAVSFADQVLPPGTYDGIKFKIHQLQHGEHREDSDEHNGHSRMMKDSVTDGSSLMVWGSVLKNGTWISFIYKYDGELEFKIKGNFTVASAVSSYSIALNFNMGLWFKDPRTGALLDPTDLSGSTRNLIREAIKRSFEGGRGGRDDNRDGHPDH